MYDIFCQRFRRRTTWRDEDPKTWLWFDNFGDFMNIRFYSYHWRSYGTILLSKFYWTVSICTNVFGGRCLCQKHLIVIDNTFLIDKLCSKYIFNLYIYNLSLIYTFTLFNNMLCNCVLVIRQCDTGLIHYVQRRIDKLCKVSTVMCIV